MGAIAWILAVCATAAGIGSLIARNWVVSLIGLATLPAAFLAMLFSGGICFS